MGKENRTSLVIIIVLVVLIAVASGILVVTTIPERQANTTEAQTQQSVSEETVSGDELENVLNQQPMFVDGVKYYYASSSSQLQHDAMGATVYNNSDVQIKRFVIAFCAFDENGKPIRIKQPGEGGNGAYVRTVSYDLSTAGGDKKYIAPEESFENVVFYVTNDPQIVTIKACVKEYESVDGIMWYNSYYNAFKDNYSGKELMQ